MNITNELLELYTVAKKAKKFDLAFRILMHLAKLRPPKISLNMLSNEDMKTLIAECKALSPEGEALSPEGESY